MRVLTCYKIIQEADEFLLLKCYSLYTADKFPTQIFVTWLKLTNYKLKGFKKLGVNELEKVDSTTYLSFL